jgi:hypothetical protein
LSGAGLARDGFSPEAPRSPRAPKSPKSPTAPKAPEAPDTLYPATANGGIAGPASDGSRTPA